MPNEKIYDIIIIGAGPAGITAAVYATRKGMDILVLTGDIGGQTIWSGNIENYTGYQFISGADLAAKFDEHMKKYGIPVNQGEEVTSMREENEVIAVDTAKATYKARTVIVASGKRSRELNVPGEKEYKNRGITYCATCDGPLFSGKKVAIVGGGNSALDAALQLIKIAEHVYIVNVASQITGDEIMSQKVSSCEKVTIFNDSQVLSVGGEDFVNTMKVKTPGGEQDIAVEGVFVEIGLLPNSEFAGILDRNDAGEIKVDSHNRTNIKGIYAAGDVTDIPEKQIIIAAGEGAKAALGVFSYISRTPNKDWK